MGGEGRQDSRGRGSAKWGMEAGSVRFVGELAPSAIVKVVVALSSSDGAHTGVEQLAATSATGKRESVHRVPAPGSRGGSALWLPPPSLFNPRSAVLAGPRSLRTVWNKHRLSACLRLWNGVSGMGRVDEDLINLLRMLDRWRISTGKEDEDEEMAERGRSGGPKENQLRRWAGRRNLNHDH